MTRKVAESSRGSEELSSKPHANPNKAGGRAVELASRECRCGHDLAKHHNGCCLVLVDLQKMKYCVCDHYIPKDAHARK